MPDLDLSPPGSTPPPDLGARRPSITAWIAGLLVLAVLALGGYLLFGRSEPNNVPVTTQTKPIAPPTAPLTPQTVPAPTR